VRELVDRMRALEHHVHDAGAARREEFAGGVAYFNDALPSVQDLNFLRLDRSCPQPAAEAERLQAGLPHRKMLIEEDRLIDRFAPALRERGFGERRLIALAREPGGVLDPDVRELAYAELRALRTEVVAELLTPPEPAVIAQMVEAEALTESAGGRWLALFEGDRPVAHCVVFSYGGLAQIEDVATLDRFQKRGYSRRLLGHALELIAADHDMVFIVAEAEEWPVAFYERIGFERVEERADFLLVIAST
jgi:ribosomal protein S18 acetylase RimI-like enzyme